MSERTRSDNQGNHIVVQRVSAERFREIEAGIEAGKRLKQALRPTDGSRFDRDVVEQLRDLERDARQGRHGMQEVQVNVRHCRPVRYVIRFESEAGKSLDQAFVSFLKPDGSYVHPDGDPVGALAFNADTYDLRMRSYQHKMYLDFDTTTMPAFGQNGAFTGTYTLYEDTRG